MNIIAQTPKTSTWTFHKHNRHKETQKHTFHVPVFEAGGYRKGRSAVQFNTDLGVTLTMSPMAEILEHLDRLTVDGKHIHGTWTFVKQGSTVSLRPVWELDVYDQIDTYEDDTALELLGLTDENE